MVKTSRVALIVVPILAVAGGAVWLGTRAPTPTAGFQLETKSVREIIGDSGQAAIAAMDRVESWLVFAPRNKIIWEEDKTTYEPGPTLSPEQIERLQQLLLGDGSVVVTNAQTACLFNPDTQFRAFGSDGRELLRMTLCFGCREVWLDIPSVSVPTVYSRPAFELAEELFPHRSFERGPD